MRREWLSIARMGHRALVPAHENTRTMPLLVLASLLVLEGCGAGLRMHEPEVKVVAARTLLLPVSTLGYSLDFSGNHGNESEQTSKLGRIMGFEVERQTRAKGVVPVPFEKVRACGSHCTSLLATLINWGETAVIEIAAEKNGIVYSGRSSVGEWQSRRDFGPLRKAVDADFALVVYVRDIRETDGRVFGDVLIRRRTYFKQVFAACTVELSSGRMVWCESFVDREVDLTSPKEARLIVEELLAGF